MTIYDLFSRYVEDCITIDGTPIFVRVGSSDVRVAKDMLEKKSYDYIDISAPSVIVDAGANIGASAIYFARRFPGAVVYAIEPEENNFKMLLQNTSHYSRIIPIQAALWGSSCQLSIRNRYTGEWGFTVADTFNRHKDTGQVVDCISVMDLMETYGIDHIDILKVDIEGAEADVFRKAGGWIDKVSIIAIELHDRICSGCEESFFEATKNFDRIVRRKDLAFAFRSKTPVVVGSV